MRKMMQLELYEGILTSSIAKVETFMSSGYMVHLCFSTCAFSDTILARANRDIRYELELLNCPVFDNN